jgi:carboxylesterase
MTSLMPGAEPFFSRGGPVGALLIHGFTGAPKEMRPLGEALRATGHTVLGLRLPQHGTTPSDMFHAQASDWFQAALDGYQLLRNQCDSIFVMGLSMGGALSLWLAAHYPVTGVVAMSTPSYPFHEHMDWRARFANWFSLLAPYVPKKPYPVSDPAMRAQRVAYPTYPTRAITQFRTVIRLAAQALPQITAPALVVHSRADETIPPENLPYIYEHLGSADKEMLWLEHSGHVITEEAERQQLFDHIQAFIRAHVAHAAL